MTSNDRQAYHHRVTDVVEENGRMLSPIEGYKHLPIVSLEEAVDPLISLVPKVKQMVWTVKQNCYEPKDGLTSDESASIMLYTLEWQPKENSFYFILNRTLRAENRDTIKPWFLYLKLVLFSLSKLRSGHKHVYRGVKMDVHKLYHKDRLFFWWGFSSCTTTSEVLQAEQFLGQTGERTMFHIKCTSGKKIRHHSMVPTEDEILLPPARQFKVTAHSDLGNGLRFIQLKEIEPPFHLIEPVSVVSVFLL